MNRLFFAFLLLCVTLTHAQENYDADLVSQAMKTRANATIRSDETIVDMQAADNVILRVKQAVTVWNKNGESNARLVLFYDKNTSIRSVKGEVYNAAGKLSGKFGLGDFIDESAANDFSLFEDSRVKHYLPAINTFPYTVLYNYEIRYKQNLIIPDWVPKPATDLSVEKSTYTFISKPTDELNIKTTNFGGLAQESSSEKQKVLRWTVEQMPASRTEPYSPDPESYRCSVKISPKQFNYYNHKGSYNNWAELGLWVYNDLLKSRRTLPPATVETIRALIQNESNDEDKARKIYQYMQNKTRYISVQIGIGGFQPVAAAEVDRLGYGDCKALVNYMQSLLDVAKIESYYCVVEAGSLKKSIDPGFASMVQGNHVILCMPMKGDTTWLECTNQKIPYGFLGDFTDDRLVLACTEEGGKVLRTPKFSSKDNLQIRQAMLDVTPEGDLSGRMTTVYSGTQYENHEEAIDKPLSEQKKLLTGWYSLDNINFTGVSYIQKKNVAPQLSEDLNFIIRNYAVINGDKLFLQINPFNISHPSSESRNRQLPLYINRGYMDEDRIEFNLPENLITKALPDMNRKIESPFGSYVAEVTLNKRQLSYYRKLVLNEGEFKAEQYADFAKFMAEVSTADQLKLILSLKK